MHEGTRDNNEGANQRHKTHQNRRSKSLTMAPKTTETSLPDRNQVGGGFSVGMGVNAIAKQNTCHGDTGVVARCCKNDSKTHVHVEFESNVGAAACLPVSSLELCAENSAENTTGTPSENETPMSEVEVQTAVGGT